MLSKAFKSVRTITPVANRAMATSSQPKRVVVTGAAGQISYSILFRIARYETMQIMMYI
jgi:FlaA1/EpsC-like NDP-sugar epimerase